MSEQSPGICLFGDAAREIARKARAAAPFWNLELSNEAITRTVWLPVRKLLPLDAVRSEEQHLLNEPGRKPAEPMKGIPSVIAFGLRQRPELGLDDQTLGHLWRQEIAPSMRAYLALLLDYQSQVARSATRPDLLLSMTLSELLLRSRDLVGLLKIEDRQSCNVIFDQLILVTGADNAGDRAIEWSRIPASLPASFVSATQILFPCLVRVQTYSRVAFYETFQTIAVDAYALEEGRTGINLWGDSQSQFFIKPNISELYYLPPKWRFGTRFSYRIDLPGKPLFRCRLSLESLTQSVINALTEPNVLDQLRSRVFEDCVADWARHEYSLPRIRKRHSLPVSDGGGPEVDVFGEITSGNDKILVVICECKLCISGASSVGLGKARQLVQQVRLARRLWPEARVKAILISNGDFETDTLHFLETEDCEVRRATLTSNWRTRPDWKIEKVEVVHSAVKAKSLP